MAKRLGSNLPYWTVSDLAAKPRLQQDLKDFVEMFEPLETLDRLILLRNSRTNALYCECHTRASKFIPLSTTDVPLDPQSQPEYRANREMVEDHQAYLKMQEDAKHRRNFSNIVAEFTRKFDSSHPLKIIGGQHRYEAIKGAATAGIDEYHGFKVYFHLTQAQRLDAQLISNTNIAISGDLLDRMQETVRGPGLRGSAQEVGLLAKGQDFSDRRSREKPITVQLVRTFIINYCRGKQVDAQTFDTTDTTPVLCRAGADDPEWEALLQQHPDLLHDQQLEEAAREYIALVTAQRQTVASRKPKKGPIDHAEKGLHLAVLAAWAFVAGVLQKNQTRLKRHYDLKNVRSKDPLNADALGRGRHKTDPENYRGLGYRTNTKERGRFAELFYCQAEDGKGISKQLIDLALNTTLSARQVSALARS